MIYLIGWVATYCVVLIQETIRYRGLVLTLGILLYFTVVAFFRGSVGTDTGTYEIIFRGYSDGYEWNGQEPGFVLLGINLIAIFQDTDIAVRACALVFFFLLAVFLIRGDRNELFHCLAYFLPVFAYSYSMNVLRIGLAACIILLATQAIRKGSLMRVFFTGLPGVLLHYSALFSVSYIIMTQRPWLKFLSVLGMLALLVLSAVGFLLVETYLMDKAELYEANTEMGASRIIPSIFGVFRISIILIVLLFGKLPAADKFKLFMLGELVVLAAAIISNYTYAGIRLYDIASLVCPLSILASYSRLGLDFENSLKAVFIASGLLGVAASYRGYLVTAGTSKNSFLPYDTWLF
jgi:hypothetical protein